MTMVPFRRAASSLASSLARCLFTRGAPHPTAQQAPGSGVAAVLGGAGGAAVRGGSELHPSLLPQIAQVYRGYKIDVVDVRNGMVVEKSGRLYMILKAVHTAGQARAAGGVQLEMRDIEKGSKSNERHRVGVKVEIVRVVDKTLQYLYTDGNMLVLMDTSTYDQTELDVGFLGDMAAYLEDGMDVKVSYHETDGRPLSVSLPDHVACVVAETQANVQGAQTAPTYKPATLANGIEISVPAYISIGDTVIVSTKDNEYMRREAKGRGF